MTELTQNGIRTGIGIWSSRYLDPRGTAQYAQGLEAAGHIDQFVVWDQLTSWWPNKMWLPENTPLAAQAPDMDSLQDPFATVAFGLTGVKKLGWGVATDAIRREPAELAQTMLTLAMATEGQSTVCLGAGEVRHISPFGRKRSIGLKRLDESLQILRLLLREDHLVEYDGELWKMREAWLGNAGKDRLPEVIAMGGGPQLTDMALRYADGLGAGTPFVFSEPDRYAETVVEHRSALKKLGRDPDEFTFALHHVIFIVGDGDDFERYVDNPMLKWYAATGGRFDQKDWRTYGLEPPFPDDWHYAWKMKPNSMTLEQVYEILDRVPAEMVRKTFLHGTPKQIAEQIRPYGDAGCNLHLIADLAPLLVPTEPETTIRQSSEICRLVKESG